MEHSWFKLNETRDVVTPSLLVYPDRIEGNIQKLIEIAGGVSRLRPHIKTHKMAEVIKLQMAYGICKFKCATIPEAHLLAQCGAKDILLAYQPVGGNIPRFFDLRDRFSNVDISTIVDNKETIHEISNFAKSKNQKVSVWLDINNGMNRTGIEPGQRAIDCYIEICQSKYLIEKGFHVYDGHIHESNVESRTDICEHEYKPVHQLKVDLESLGYTVEKIVAGGTPTFPIHQKREGLELSPGTPILWDAGYASSFEDLTFLPAAVLVARVISKPKEGLLCLDLGHKSVAAEMTFPRVEFLDREEIAEVDHNEEHLVVKCTSWAEYAVGDLLYMIPTHICPTVVKYEKVGVVRKGEITEYWNVGARNH